MLGWMKHNEARIKIAGRNINNLRYADDTTLRAETEEELNKKPLDESERGEFKSWLKTQHSRHLVPPLYGKQMGKQWK